MNLEEIRLYCLSKKQVEEGFPFGPEVLVFKVMGKIFALLPMDTGDSVNLKAEPEQAVAWREEFAEVKPGYHMNKKHWNTVDLRGRLSKKMIAIMIDHSYDCVVSSLPKKQRLALGQEE